jgi:aspartate ammonia-lyase
MTEFRLEHDLIGDENVPADAYYGIQTMRAMHNFDITGVPISHFPQLIRSLAMVKKAAALANSELGHLDKSKSKAIIAACDEIIDGKLHDQFPVDLIQGGAGTSTNMNANEVIANRALEILGHKKGEYQYLHPNNDVNMVRPETWNFLLACMRHFSLRGSDFVILMCLFLILSTLVDRLLVSEYQ